MTLSKKVEVQSAWPRVNLDYDSLSRDVVGIRPEKHGGILNVFEKFIVINSTLCWQKKDLKVMVTSKNRELNWCTLTLCIHSESNWPMPLERVAKLTNNVLRHEQDHFISQIHFIWSLRIGFELKIRRECLTQSSASCMDALLDATPIVRSLCPRTWFLVGQCDVLWFHQETLLFHPNLQCNPNYHHE